MEITTPTQFAKKDTSPVDLSVVQTMVPPVYFWLDIFNEKPEKMTACVMWNDLRFGLSFPVAENKVQARIDSSKLLTHMREVASVLSLHGKEVLDSNQQLDLKKINEQEAIRFTLDPLWAKRVRAVDKLIKVKDISREQALKLKLI